MAAEKKAKAEHEAAVKKARAEKIARKPLPDGVERSAEHKAPASNLKEIVLFDLCVICLLCCSCLKFSSPICFTFFCNISNTA